MIIQKKVTVFMLCQNCKKRDADVHLKQILNGEAAEISLCRICAASLGYSEIFSGFSGASDSVPGSLSTIGNKLLRCETCGFSFGDISQTGRPGCPECYKLFGDKLSKTLVKYHGRTSHKGKTPGEKTEGISAHGSDYGSIVTATSVTLGRNLSSVPFPVRLNTVQKNALNLKICEALKNGIPDITFTDISTLSHSDVLSLAEKRLITPSFATAGPGHVLCLTPDKRLSVELNDEDHIRITASEYGLNPEGAYLNAENADCILTKAFGAAFDSKLGFLTQNPQNIGTAMKISVYMHLPVLTATGKTAAISSTISKLGFSVRGGFANDVSIKGDIYKISNTVTLGISERDALQNLKSICLQLATEERAGAEKYIESVQARDKINRAAGVLANAVLLTTDEMEELLSLVRLGSVYGLCSFSVKDIDSLMINLQPACINSRAGEKLQAAQRDEIRAKTVKETLFK